MNIEIMILLTIVSVVFAVYQGVISLSREKSKDDKDDTVEITAMRIILEHIREDVKETKEDVKKLNTDTGEIISRLSKVEASTKRAHERLDNLISNNNVRSDIN